MCMDLSHVHILKDKQGLAIFTDDCKPIIVTGFSSSAVLPGYLYLSGHPSGFAKWASLTCVVRFAAS